MGFGFRVPDLGTFQLRAKGHGLGLRAHVLRHRTSEHSISPVHPKREPATQSRLRFRVLGAFEPSVQGFGTTGEG